MPRMIKSQMYIQYHDRYTLGSSVYWRIEKLLGNFVWILCHAHSNKYFTFTDSKMSTADVRNKQILCIHSSLVLSDHLSSTCFCKEEISYLLVILIYVTLNIQHCTHMFTCDETKIILISYRCLVYYSIVVSSNSPINI